MEIGMPLRDGIEHAKFAQKIAEECGVDGRDCAYQHDKLYDWLMELQQYRDADKIRTYFFTMKQAHHRTGAIIGQVVGIVRAETAEEAETKAWEQAGSDSRCALELDDITELVKNGVFSFVVYKSEM